jgi:hypothetical protein
MKCYAGIGSRDTPATVLKQMTEIARKLSQLKYTLRSGGAEGADTAFEAGAKTKQIFLPWEGFNRKYSDGVSYFVPNVNTDLVKRFHPKYDNLKESAIRLMSRNSYQVLGSNLNDPVEFVLCWTKEGKMVGGTSQALRIANHYKIPVFNLWHGPSDFAKFLINSRLFLED